MGIFTSQCCVSFCCTRKWISYTYTHIPSLLDLHSTPRSAQSTWLSCLSHTAASHSPPTGHVAVWVHQTSPPDSPSYVPHVRTLLSVSMSLLLSVLQSCLTPCILMDCSPPGSCPWNSPGKNTRAGCHFPLVLSLK